MTQKKHYHPLTKIAIAVVLATIWIIISNLYFSTPSYAAEKSRPNVTQGALGLIAVIYGLTTEGNNDFIHGGGAAIVANVTRELPRNKNATAGQRWWRGCRNGVGVNLLGEAAQGLSGKGVADWRDVGWGVVGGCTYFEFKRVNKKWVYQ